jgi:hypothetical protein
MRTSERGHRWTICHAGELAHPQNDLHSNGGKMLPGDAAKVRFHQAALYEARGVDGNLAAPTGGKVTYAQQRIRCAYLEM